MQRGDYFFPFSSRKKVFGFPFSSRKIYYTPKTKGHMTKRIVSKKGKSYEYHSIEINGLQSQVAQDLKNIASNLGMSLSEFLKPKLREVRDSYPVNMRQKNDD